MSRIRRIMGNSWKPRFHELEHESKVRVLKTHSHTPPLLSRLVWRRLATTLVKHAAHYFSIVIYISADRSGGRVRSFVPGGQPLLCTREMIVSRSVNGKAPKRRSHSIIIAVSGSGYARNEINSLKLSSLRKSASQAVFSRTPHGASRLVHVMSACSVKTRHAPSRHFRGADVYGHRPRTRMRSGTYLLSRTPPHLLTTRL